MDELWMRTVATIHDGKIEDFKRLAEELLGTIRAKDSGTLNYAIFLDEPARVAVILEHYASSADWFAHNANIGALTPRFAPVLPGAVRRSRGQGEPAVSAQLSPEQVVRKFFDCYTNGRPDEFDQVVAPDYADYGHTPPGRGPGGARDDYHNAVSQADAVIGYTIDALVADGDTVAAAWTGTLPGGTEIGKGLSLYRTSGGLLRSTRHALITTTPAASG